MVQPHLDNQVAIALLMTLKYSGGVRRFQNYNPSGTIVWSNDGLPYEFLPMQFPGIPQSLDLDNVQANASVPNSPSLRAFILGSNRLIEAIAVFTRIFPEYPNAAPVTSRLQIIRTTFAGSEIRFELSSPLNAIAGRIPAQFFDSTRFPELPSVEVQTI